MKRILTLSIIILIFYGCNSYKNKDRYEIKVGETVEIYYSTNSCCYYCLSNEKDLNHIKLIERITIGNGPEDCAGCNHTSAFVFKAESPGIDTVELKLLRATVNCDSNNVEAEKYVIEIKH